MFLSLVEVRRLKFYTHKLKKSYKEIVYEGVEVIDQIRQGDEIEKILIFED